MDSNIGTWVKVTKASEVKTGERIKETSFTGNVYGGDDAPMYVTFKKGDRVDIKSPVSGSGSFDNNIFALDIDGKNYWKSIEVFRTARVATIYGQQVGFYKHKWTIKLPVKTGYIFSSDGYYTRTADAIRAAKRICEQMNIPYKVSKD
jgi:hypothetical protein